MRAVLQISRVTEGWLWADDDTGPPEEVTLGNKRLSSMEGVLRLSLKESTEVPGTTSSEPFLSS